MKMPSCHQVISICSFQENIFALGLLSAAPSGQNSPEDCGAISSLSASSVHPDLYYSTQLSSTFIIDLIRAVLLLSMLLLCAENINRSPVCFASLLVNNLHIYLNSSESPTELIPGVLVAIGV